jgi:hypothetical protein
MFRGVLAQPANPEPGLAVIVQLADHMCPVAFNPSAPLAEFEMPRLAVRSHKDRMGPGMDIGIRSMSVPLASRRSQRVFRCGTMESLLKRLVHLLHDVFNVDRAIFVVDP